MAQSRVSANDLALFDKVVTTLVRLGFYGFQKM